VDQLAIAYQSLRRYAEADQTFTRAVTVSNTAVTTVTVEMAPK
jgi:hypothetical protein